MRLKFCVVNSTFEVQPNAPLFFSGIHHRAEIPYEVLVLEFESEVLVFITAL